MAVIGCEGRLEDGPAQIDDLARDIPFVIRDHESQQGADLAVRREPRLTPGKTQQRLGLATVEGDTGAVLGNGAIDRRGRLMDIGPAEDRGVNRICASISPQNRLRTGWKRMELFISFSFGLSARFIPWSLWTGFRNPMRRGSRLKWVK